MNIMNSFDMLLCQAIGESFIEVMLEAALLLFLVFRLDLYKNSVAILAILYD